MKDNPHTDDNELIRIINILKKEIEFLKEENDIYMKQIELLVRKNNNMKKKIENSSFSELNPTPKDLRNLLPDHLQNNSEDTSIEIYEKIKPAEDKIKQNEEGRISIEAKLKQREVYLMQWEEYLMQREEYLKLREEYLMQQEDSINEKESEVKQHKGNVIEPEDNINKTDDSILRLEDCIIEKEINSKSQEDREKKKNEQQLFPKGSVNYNKDSIYSDKDRIKSTEGSIPITKDSINHREDSKQSSDDVIKQDINTVITAKDRRESPKDSIKIIKDILSKREGNEKGINNDINSPEDSINEEEDSLTASVYSKSELKNIKIQRNSDEIESGEYEYPEKDSLESEMPVPSEKDRMPELIRTKSNLHEPSREVKELRMRLEENLNLTFRKRYMKQMIKRWVNELIYFSGHNRVKGAELMYAMGIRPATLMRDTTLFKNKGWIKYHGTKKNGYYKMTEEGIEFVKKSLTVSS